MTCKAVALVLLCGLIGAWGQFENGIVFTNGGNAINPAPAPQQQQQQQQQFVVNPLIVNDGGTNCNCVVAGTCTGSVVSPNIDIRIVNNGGSSTTCSAGYVLCCTSGSGGGQDTTCGVRKIPLTPQTVVGQASFGAYPWQAALLDRSENFLGSGVLLDSTHVLTAAHKVAAYVNSPTSLLVRLGEWDARNNNEPYQPVTVNVAKITVHPSYNSANLENDVAVIRLNGVVPIASYPNVNTACKPAAATAAGTRCYVSGWGKNLFGPNGSYQSIMREVDVPILDNTDCENRLRTTRLGSAFVLNRNSFMCAGGEVGKDACTGDGGSPLVCQRSTGQWQVVGIVAWGIGCATPGVPGVYTNVYNFLTWINSAIATA